MQRQISLGVKVTIRTEESSKGTSPPHSHKQNCSPRSLNREIQYSLWAVFLVSFFLVSCPCHLWLGQSYPAVLGISLLKRKERDTKLNDQRFNNLFHRSCLHHHWYIYYIAWGCGNQINQWTLGCKIKRGQYVNVSISKKIPLENLDA